MLYFFYQTFLYNEDDFVVLVVLDSSRVGAVNQIMNLLLWKDITSRVENKEQQWYMRSLLKADGLIQAAEASKANIVGPTGNLPSFTENECAFWLTKNIWLLRDTWMRWRWTTVRRVNM